MQKKPKVATKERFDTKQVVPVASFYTGHDIEFRIEQIVYLKMDNEQHQRMVTGISLRPNNSVTYCLAFNNTETWHYAIEITGERDIIKATTS